MPVVKNGKAIFNAVPTGWLTDDQTIQYVDTDTIDPEVVALNGGFLVKTLVTSLHLYMRLMMRAADGSPNRMPAFPLGQPLISSGVGVVLRSETKDVKPGDHVYGRLPHQEYSVIPSFTGFRILDNPDGKLPWSYFVGSAGMQGQTAYYGWREFSKAKKGETVFVTTGGGPVGSMVIQLAKDEGLRVIASAGSDEKVEFMKSIGADVAFNYKTTDTAEVLSKEGPIDVYWDNVGGEMLEAALNAANQGARFIECGMASSYGGSTSKPPNNLFNIVTKEIHMSGFIATSLAKNWEEEFYASVPQKLASGKFKACEELHEGLEKTGEAMRRHLEGKNVGAVAILVANE